MSLRDLPLKVIARKFNKTITAPSSKSYANRYLILGSLIEEDLTIRNIPPSYDVTKLIECLKKIGLEIIEQKEGLTIKGSFPECEMKTREDVISLETGDGGTINRFLIPMLSLGQKAYQIKPSGRITMRPNDELFKPILDIVSFDINDSWCSIKGPLSIKEDIRIDCSKSTQFYSSYLMLKTKNPMELLAENVNSSEKYIRITEKAIEDICVNKIRDITIPVDFSSASYLFALGATLGSVTLENTQERDELQADSVLLEILKEAGAEVEFSKKGITVSKKEELLPLNVDCSSCPDLFPTLIYLASKASGESEFKGLEVLKHKETDRLSEGMKLLDQFSINYHYDEKEDSLKVYGGDGRASVEYFSPEDHRLVMASYLFMRGHAGGTLHNSHHITKSFANFFELVEFS